MRRVFGYGTHFLRTYTATFGVASLVEILKRARRGEVDIVHVHELDTALIAWARRRGLPVPVVAHCHGLRRTWREDGVFREWERDRGPFGRTYHYFREGGVDFFLEKESLVGVDGVFAVSPHTKQELIRHLAIPPERIWVTYNGADTDQFRPNLPPFPRPLPPRPRVLTVSGDPRKGSYIFLNVAHIFHRERWPGTFLMAGYAERALRDRAGPNVRFLGFVSHREIPQLYASCDVFFLPTLSEESGKSILEAMACGMPVVTSPVEGNAGIVAPETGLTGSLERPDELARILHGLLEDPDRCRRMGETGRRRVLENFTWDHVAERVEAGYRQVVA